MNIVGERAREVVLSSVESVKSRLQGLCEDRLKSITAVVLERLEEIGVSIHQKIGVGIFLEEKLKDPDELIEKGLFFQGTSGEVVALSVDIKESQQYSNISFVLSDSREGIDFRSFMFSI